VASSGNHDTSPHVNFIFGVATDVFDSKLSIDLVITGFVAVCFGGVVGFVDCGEYALPEGIPTPPMKRSKETPHPIKT